MTVNGSKDPPQRALRIVRFIRKNGFEEKAALLENESGLAKLRIFDGMIAPTIVEKIPYSTTRKRGHWSWQ